MVQELISFKKFIRVLVMLKGQFYLNQKELKVGSRGVLSGLQSSLYAAARIVARPSPTRTFTFELSSHGSPQWNVEYNYTGKPSIPVAGLSPAGHAALRAARGRSTDTI